MIFQRLRNKLLLAERLLGINARNIDYVYRLNERRLFSRVDDKLETKVILKKKGIPHPVTFYVFRCHRELPILSRVAEERNGFAVKPSCGTGGKGILPLKSQTGSLIHVGSGEPVTHAELEEHVSDILSGKFSLEGSGDVAFLEELLEPDGILGSISFKGLPDIRVIVCKGIPVMAMLRVPTRDSRGRANLHQGAIGIGVDLKSGMTTAAVLKRRYVEKHPDLGCPLAGITVPGWRHIVEMSVAAAQAVELGYVGVDLAVSRNHGPLVIEINARPGLDIQLANRQGLNAVLPGEDA